MSAQVYSFDPQTGEYTGVTVADEDPEGDGNLLMPAFSTREMPPNAPSGFAAFWRGDRWETLSVAAPPPILDEDGEVSDDELKRRAQGLVQAMLDGAAQIMGYDNIISGVTYADEPSVPKFQIEGQRLRRLRSMAWNECYTILAEVEAGAEWPTESEFLARLPHYDEMASWEETAPAQARKTD